MNAVTRMEDYRRGEPDGPMQEPPASLEMEQAVLGALLMNNECADVLDRLYLEPEHFSEPVHREIYRAAKALIARKRPADPRTLREFLPADTIGDMTYGQYMARLIVEALPPQRIRDYAIIVLDAAAARGIYSACTKFADICLHRDPADGITDIASRLQDEIAEVVAMAPGVGRRETMSDVTDAFLRDLLDARASAAGSIPFPLPEIANVLGEEGWEPGNLYGLLGASGEGKTSLMLQMVRSAADAGHPVLLMSFDQTFKQVVRQMAAQATGITVSQMKRHKPGARETIRDHEANLLMAETEKLNRLPIQVEKVRNAKIGAILGIAKNFAKAMRRSSRPDGTAWGAPLIILDHNRKVEPLDPRWHEGRIAGSVNGAGKALAEETGAAVLFINQRNGKGDDRWVPRPIASDLFGGQQAKEDFDAILALYRPERWMKERLDIAKDAKEAGMIRDRFRIRESFDAVPEDPEGLAELSAIKVRYGSENVREIVKWEGRHTLYASRRSAPPELF